jgi:CheY-like chemotaxis protein
MPTPRILAVEDTAITQAALKRELKEYGCDIVIAGTAEEAWEILEREPAFHAVILDFHLPGEDGASFYRRFAMDPRFSSIAVIPFTAIMYADESATNVSVAQDFVTARPTAKADRSHPIVSKGGREDVSQLPGPLILSVGHALQNAGIPLPPPLQHLIPDLPLSRAWELHPGWRWSLGEH